MRDNSHEMQTTTLRERWIRRWKQANYLISVFMEAMDHGVVSSTSIETTKAARSET